MPCPTSADIFPTSSGVAVRRKSLPRTRLRTVPVGDRRAADDEGARLGVGRSGEQEEWGGEEGETSKKLHPAILSLTAGETGATAPASSCRTAPRAPAPDPCHTASAARSRR